MAQLTTLTTADQVALAAAYGWKRAVYTALPERGTVNSNYAVSVEEARYFLRINEGKSEAQVDAEARLVSFLHTSGLPTPLPVRTREHTWHALVQHKPATLFPWIIGLEADERAPGAAARAGALLAAIHRAGVGYPVAQLPPNAYDLAALGARVDRIEQAGGFADVVRIARQELGRAIERDRGEFGLIHQDLFPDNVLVDDAGAPVAVLDFEQATAGPRAYDVAVTINAWCWRDDRFDLDAAEALLAAYAEATPVPLRAGQLLGELQLAAARFLITRVTDIELAADVHPDLKARKNYREYLHRWEHWTAGHDHDWAATR